MVPSEARNLLWDSGKRIPRAKSRRRNDSLCRVTLVYSWYTSSKRQYFSPRIMPIFSRLMFQAVRWAARRGLREEERFASAVSKAETRNARKLVARSTGVRGETYAYWYLRRLSVTLEKQRVVVRTAQRFLAERHVEECPLRFDVVAIDNLPGKPPVVRLHKDAFSPQLDRQY
ncbi:MAG: hypothetical protein DMG37_21485 [Acidobacteria bacterium]|nr:MAG: hypothetical protein DMG37_21485 [Acidobacteriota bacterium]